MAIGLGAALAAVALLAQAPAGAEKPAETAKPEKPKKICVEEEQMGSHFKRRICATPEEWEKRREKDAANMSRARANAPNPN
jgi:hypothetical protein